MKLFVLLLAAAALHAETGYDAWLRYVPVRGTELPPIVVALGDSAVLRSARDEAIRGAQGMLGENLRISSAIPNGDCIVLGTLAAVRRAAPDIELPETLIDDGYVLKTAKVRGRSLLVVASSNDRGVLYGTFALLRKVALGEDWRQVNETHAPFAPIRWTNEWDNLDGSIERGYAGRSIFFEGGNMLADLHRAGDYARLLASIGIN